MNTADRFADPGLSIYELATHYLVHCPKCEGRANVLPHDATWRLTCTHCFHTELKGKWYGRMTAYVSVKCRECNQHMARSADVTGEWAKLKMHCESCGDTCEYEAKLSRHYQKDGQMCDAVFGCALWYQKEFRQDNFWAFNLEHLQIIEDFVRAKLRERGIDPKNTYKKNSSIVRRLPVFISKAQNREEILKLIDELKLKKVRE